MLLRFLRINTISWIPDFQHIHYPQNFTEQNIRERDSKYSNISKEKFLVLSSNDAKKDFVENYPDYSCKIAVVPFVSYIEKTIESITVDDENKVLKTFGLERNQYFCVCNQFWKHKNHIVVFKAIRELSIKYPELRIKFVFTGQMSDDRNPEYINELKNYANDQKTKDKITILGFLPRKDQLIIIKNAKAVIQPSLFEGWGTVVEDAKVLDKTVILSDIPIHREQMNKKCKLFNPYDAEQLAELIMQENSINQIDDLVLGINDMKHRAYEYSKGFEKLLDNK